VEVPEWYTAGLSPPETQLSSFARDVAGLQILRSMTSSQDSSPLPKEAHVPNLEHWDILSGGSHLADCPDTVQCLRVNFRLLLTEGLFRLCIGGNGF